MPYPTVSVITCTRNSEPWVAESIASVLKQRSVCVEYIFVDGGSSDGTLERIRDLQRPYTLIENIRGGISEAMNVGIEAARGEIIAHLHSDDFYLHEDVLHTVLQAFQKHRCRWLYGRTMRCIEGRLSPEGFVAPAFSKARLLRGNFIPHPATFVTRELIWRAGGFDPRLRYAMDYDLWLRLSRLTLPMALPQALTAFREHAGSVSTRERAQAMREDLKVRLAHTGIDPVARAMHFLRYAVRRQRARSTPTEVTHA